MRGICSVDDTGTQLFLKGEAVGIITFEQERKTKYHGMVFNVEEFRELVASHSYMPLLYRCSIPLRIAYIYGCLPEKYGVSKTEKLRVLWRRIDTSEWKNWFIVEHIHEDPLS